jgi:tripartite-type tricarboxylate transporter receptor subunit TctC
MKPSKFVIAAWLLSWMTGSTPGMAQESPWPSKPVRLIVSGPPGGVVYIRARWLADRLSPLLGQPVIIDNRPGAGGVIGTEAGARSAPDGYTLTMIHQGTMTINPHVYPKLPYDPLTDFAPITQVGVGAMLLAVHPGLPVASVGDLVRLAKSKPGQLAFGSPEVGTPPHLAAELFKQMTGIESTHVPYKGGAQSVSDLIAGHVAWSIEGLTVQLPQVKAGKLRGLAVTSAERLAIVPDIPTIAEAGVPGYEFTGWVGIAAPAATPKPIVARIYAEIAKVLGSREASEWFGSYGAEPGGDPPDKFAATIRAQHAKWGKLIR